MISMSSSPAVRSAKTFPNILLIVMDATRTKNLSGYGYYRPTTPNLDRFAERCVLYETAISPGGWSLPGHASIFTGLYPSRHGAHEQHKYLSPEYPTMAELLRSYGYRTLAFCHNRYVGPATGLDRGFDGFNHNIGGVPRPLRKVARKIDSGAAILFGLHDSGARHTNRQIQAAMRQSQADERPFFMFVHYEEPHAPYRPPRKYNCYLPENVSPKEATEVNQDQWQYFVDPTSMNEQDFEILTALYDAEITYLDARIAEVLNFLEELDILDQTMVIITADHGENIGDHRMMGHQYCLYDTLLHVPFIVHYPRGIATPGRISYQVQTLDILPTVLAMLGDTSSQVYHSLQGLNLLSSTRHEFTIAEWERPDLTKFYQRFPDMDVSRYDRSLKMIRADHHKYIWASDGRHELYDLQVDPDEARNVVAEYREIAKDLEQRLTEWRASFEIATLLDEVPEFDKTVKERLRELGYLE